MSQPTFADLQPLIANQRLEGPRVIVSFRCPATGVSVASIGEMSASSDHAGRRYAEVAARSAQWSMRSELARSVSRMIGGGMMGSMAHQQVMRGTSKGAQIAGRTEVFNDKDRENAVVRAFMGIADQFKQDDSGRWVHLSAQQVSSSPPPVRPAAPKSPTPANWTAPPSVRPPTSASLPPAAARPAPPVRTPAPPVRTPAPPVHRAAPATHSAPPVRAAAPPVGAAARGIAIDPNTFAGVVAGADLDDASDRRVVVGMMVGTALADGVVSEEERTMLKALGASPSDLEASSPPVTDADLRGTKPSAREAMLIMAMGVAYADGRMEHGEMNTLQGYGDALGVSRSRYAALDRMAREHLVELLIKRTWADGAPDAAAERKAMNQATRLSVTAVQIRQIKQRLGL